MQLHGHRTRHPPLRARGTFGRVVEGTTLFFGQAAHRKGRSPGPGVTAVGTAGRSRRLSGPLFFPHGSGRRLDAARIGRPLGFFRPATKERRPLGLAAYGPRARLEPGRQRRMVPGTPSKAESPLTIRAPARRAVARIIPSAKLAEGELWRRRRRERPPSSAISGVTSQILLIRRIAPQAASTRSACSSRSRRAASSPSEIADVCNRCRPDSTNRCRSETPVGVRWRYSHHAHVSNRSSDSFTPHLLLASVERSVRKVCQKAERIRHSTLDQRVDRVARGQPYLLRVADGDQEGESVSDLADVSRNSEVGHVKRFCFTSS